MSNLIERAKAHFSEQPVRHIDVPEWGTGGKPLRVHCRPLSIASRRKCWRNEAGETVDGTVACVRAVLFQALDTSGSRLFDDMDEKALMYDVDSDVVARIGAFILGFSAGKPKAAEEEVEAAKNG